VCHNKPYGLHINDVDGKQLYTLKPSERDKVLLPGTYLIRVAGADGLELDTKEFTLKQGDKVVVRVFLKPPDDPKIVEGKKNGTLLDPDRTLAQEVLKLEGTVIIQGKRYTKLAELPEAPFRVSYIDLASKNGVTEELLKQLNLLEELRGINLSYTTIKDPGLELLKSLKGIEELWVESAGIEGAGLKVLKEMPSLLNINLNHNRIRDEDFQNVRYLEKLTSLSASRTEITDDSLRYLAKLSELRVLELSNNKKIDGNGFRQLGGLVNLAELHVNNTKIDDAALAHLVELPLIRLSLKDNARVTDGGILHLKKMKKLRTLWLQNTNISEQGLKELTAVLQVQGCEINPVVK
jgi:hypothetical protein